MSDKPTISTADKAVEKPAEGDSSTYLVGGALGMLLGVLTAYLYRRTAKENNGGSAPRPISTGELFRLALAAVALIRQISDLAVNKGKK